MNLTEYLSEIEQRLQNVTPGPWFNDAYGRSIRVTYKSPAFGRGNFNIAKYPMRTNESLVSHVEWEANAELIANAPTYLATLLNIVRVQQETIKSFSEGIALLSIGEAIFIETYIEVARHELKKCNQAQAEVHKILGEVK